MQQAFTRPRLEAYLQELQPRIVDRIERFPVGSVRLADQFKSMLLSTALEVFIGVELPQSEADRINRAFITCLESLNALVRYPIPGGKWAAGRKSRRELEEFFHGLIPQKRKELTPDLFSVLCHTVGDDQHSFTDEDIVSHMIFLLFAAHDTSTTTLTTIAYNMGRFPEWQHRARQRAFDLGPNLTHAELEEMIEIDLVMKESLRMNPPVPVSFWKMLRERRVLRPHAE